jgi:hypothetical protein
LRINFVDRVRVKLYLRHPRVAEAFSGSTSGFAKARTVAKLSQNNTSASVRLTKSTHLDYLSVYPNEYKSILKHDISKFF